MQCSGYVIIYQVMFKQALVDGKPIVENWVHEACKWHTHEEIQIKFLGNYD